MIVQSFKNVIVGNSDAEKELNISQGENILSLEVNTEQIVCIQVSGQMESADTFLPTAAIKMSNFTAVEEITEAGLYMIDTTALSKIKISVSQTADDLIVSGRTFDDSK